jgi:hypothetical protein
MFGQLMNEVKIWESSEQEINKIEITTRLSRSEKGNSRNIKLHLARKGEIEWKKY